MNTEIRRCGLTDIHTHILPRFDDGSSSSAESFVMLRELYLQGVGSVVLTPHFYATEDEPDLFVTRRDEAAEHLAIKIGELCKEVRAEGYGDAKIPTVYLGAEVAFFNAMSLCAELERMCICGTRYLLLEMPFDNWTQAMIQELKMIKKNRGITPVIAHIERYFSLFKSSMLDEMIDEGILIQSNAEAFLRFGTRHRALKLLEEGKIHLLGSDCHNMGKRAPNVSGAIDVIEKKLGGEYVDKLCLNSAEILETAEAILPSRV